MLARTHPPGAVRTVVVLNDYCHINGGASRVAIDEAVALAEAGLDVIFFGANGPVCRELAEAPLSVVNLGQPELVEAGRDPRVLLQGLWNNTAARRLARSLDDLDPAHTIVHLHGYTKALTTAPVRTATDRGFRIVCTLHDFFAACPNGSFFDYVENAPCGRAGLSASCVLANCDKRHRAHKLYRLVRSGIQLWPGRFPAAVDAYISLSDRSAEILRPYLPRDAAVFPLENMISVVWRDPVRVAEGNAVVAVGRLDREKGVEMLVEASRRTGVSVTFVGDGPLRPLVEQSATCRVTGWLSPREVEGELEAARCLAFPSLWYETYGLVVSEAAARGVPAIVSDISAAAERVRHRETGWIFPSGNVAELAACLAKSRDDALIERMGAAAYAGFWSNPPDRESHVLALKEIYRSVLASRTETLPLKARSEVAAR